MSIRQRRIPGYRLHKPTGQAVVRIDGHDHYLGKHGTQASVEAYHRLIAEWLTAGRRRGNHGPAADASESSINELLLAFWRHAREHYRHPDGAPTGELDNLRDALRPLRRLYGNTRAREFGPVALRAVREEMVRSGLCRTTVNARVRRVRRVFKWAASVELVSAGIYQGLQTVDGLQRGRCSAPEPPLILPVAAGHVEAALPFLPRPVAAMVRLQLLTACRAGEVMAMRGRDLTPVGPVWEYRPALHKNAWRGHERVVLLGPQAQAVVREFLDRDPEDYLFSPRDAVEQMRVARRAVRKTRRAPSEQARQGKAKPTAAGERYHRRSYRQAVVRACAKAGVPAWSPLQLRHTAATRIRARYGVEATKAVLGHSRVETAQLYAERDLNGARTVMAESG